MLIGLSSLKTNCDMLELSITKLIPHYIWQDMNDWFRLPVEGEQ